MTEDSFLPVSLFLLLEGQNFFLFSLVSVSNSTLGLSVKSSVVCGMPAGSRILSQRQYLFIIPTHRDALFSPRNLRNNNQPGLILASLDCSGPELSNDMWNVPIREFFSWGEFDILQLSRM